MVSSSATILPGAPVILPSGSEVKPLAWSPSDSQMVEAHQMSLQDVANEIDGLVIDHA